MKVRRFLIPDFREGPVDAPAPRGRPSPAAALRKTAFGPTSNQLLSSVPTSMLCEPSTATEELIPQALPAPLGDWRWHLPPFSPSPEPKPHARAATPSSQSHSYGAHRTDIGFGGGCFLETPTLENSWGLSFFKMKCCC